MDLTRREMLAGAATGASAMLLPSWAGAATPAGFGPVARRVTAFAEAVLAYNGFPGVSLALVGPNGYSSALAVGLSDAARQEPATPDQLFQIGSITKSLTAMAVFALADRGRIDLAARVRNLLPDLPLPPEPITVTHLLEHSSGLANSLDRTGFLAVPGGRLWTGFTPGSHYSYCNLGYALLGMVVERAAGMPFPQALRTLVLQPIGMGAARPTIQMADRPAFAVGHVRLREDVPWMPGARLTAARWMDFHSPSGSVSASARDMVHYLRQVIELGRGRGAPIFSDAAAERFRTPTIDAPGNGRGARYGNGLVTLDVGGRTCLRHTGGMIAFSSSMTVDPEAGVGCYASVNVGGAGGYRPNEISEYAIALLRAAAAGQLLPEPPQPQRPTVSEPGRFAGRWTSTDGREMVIAEQGEALTVAAAGLVRPLVPAGAAAVATDHPALAPFLLSLEGGDRPLLRLGDRLFGKGQAPVLPPVSPRLAPLAGSYFSPAAWTGARLNVHAVGDTLYLGTSKLEEGGDGSWRFADPSAASERIWFENVANGRPEHLNFSGTRYGRMPEA